MSIFLKNDVRNNMSDLIISINFDESKKKNNLVIETYEGIIPMLKSKKYSGQLRNININSQISYNNINNINNIQLKQIQNFLNDNLNVQVNKHQYFIAKKKLYALAEIVCYNCVFYKDKKHGMYQITQICFGDIINQNFYEIDGLRFYGNKTEVFLDIEDIDNQAIINVQARVYVDLNKNAFPLELIFEYDDMSISYSNKERAFSGKTTFRNYGFEEKTQKYIESCGWKYKRAEGFKYQGKNIASDLSKLSNYGIIVLTNMGQKIATSDFSNISVSYNFDWFDIEGMAEIDGETVNISHLFNMKKKADNWVEYKGKIVFLPKVLNSKSVYFDKNESTIKIDKKNIIDAISIANGINGSGVKNISNLIGYKNISCEIDTGIEKLLRSYQKTGVKWLLSLKKNGFGGCLADDMGLGKTLQIIAYLSEKSLCNSRNLIVVPKTLLVNWMREFSKFSPSTTVYSYHGGNRDIRMLNKHKVIITTYQTLVNDEEKIEKLHFNNLIIDEAQYIKNHKSKAHQALKHINATTKIILTGTPLENNLEEFWGLMKLINPNITTSYRTISAQGLNDIEYVRKISSPFLLRRMKNDVLDDLPQKQKQVLYVKMESKQQELYDKMLESIRYEILRKNDRFEIKSNSIMLNGLLYLQEICCHPKLLKKEYNEDGCTESAKFNLLLDLIESLYCNKHKVVVFSRFTKMLEIIRAKLISMHFNYYYLDGNTSDRISVVDDFEKSPNGVFLISLKAGGTGINLVSADTAIIYDPWWNPAIEKQAEDRIYRIGQKKNVMIYRLITEGTIEEKIQTLQKEKYELSCKILDGHEVPMSITSEIMQQLIMD